ncbi:MAG: GntR family transcriptional regulator [Pseudomonadota bacterium]
MARTQSKLDRRTNADDVFDYLHGQIVSLKLLPGTRISEVEIAKQFDVSRQPVREAFIRLANLDLLVVRPQRATVVRRFSAEKIERARFVRLSVECEVLRRACATATEQHHNRLLRDLENQKSAIESHDIDRFHTLDYDFHKHLCEAGNVPLMFGTIMENKVSVDRLCVLSLSEPAAMDVLYEDHSQITTALRNRDEPTVITAITRHLSRLDDVITGIRKSHADFFDT